MAKIWHHVGAVSCLLTLSLAGCSDEQPEGTVLGDDAPSPTTTPTPSTPSPTPPIISPTTGESPTRTLVRQFVEMENYVRATGDTEPLLALSHPECQSCQGIAEVVGGVYESGGTYEGDYRERIVAMEGDGKRILVVTEAGDWSVLPSPGADRIVRKAGRTTADYILEQEGDRWVVREIRVSAD